MRHDALPQTMTPEQLGEWLVDNNIDKKYHEDDAPYTEEEIVAFEHDSSVASRNLDRLNDLEAEIKELLNNGNEEPVDKTIPPTKGRKILKKNREWADTQIEQGSKMEEVVLYGIPFSKTGLILYFDIEGNVWDSYELEMTPEQKEKYVGLFDQEQSDNTIGNITNEKAEKKKSSKSGEKKTADANKVESINLGDDKPDSNSEDQIKETPADDKNEAEGKESDWMDNKEDPNAGKGKGDETPELKANENETDNEEEHPSQDQDDSIVSASPVEASEGGPEANEEHF